MRLLIKALTSGYKRKFQRIDLHFLSAYLTAFAIISLMLISVPGAYSIETDELKERNLTVVERLRINLFTNYDKNLQPTVGNLPTNITLGLFIKFIDVDEMDGKLTMHCWLKVTWMDDLRAWRKQDYDNVSSLHLLPRDVWKPEISLFNSAGESGDYLGEKTPVILYESGTFLWVPPAIYTAYCNLNMRHWPYDKQMCKFKIGSWTLNSIDFENDLKRVYYDSLIQSTEWQITNAKAAYQRRDYYNFIEYTLELQRRSSMYTAIIYTPAWCIILLALSSFWLPPQMGEKILLNGIVIVIIAAFLMYFAQLLPILADNIPLIVIFYSASLLLLSISTIIAVIVLYLATAKHKRRLPEFLKRLLNGKFGSILLLSNFSYESELNSVMHNGTKELEEHVYDNDDTLCDPLGINPEVTPSTRALQFDWVLFATAVDRTSFLCYCIVFVSLAIVYAN